LSLKDVKPLSIEMREVPSMRTLWKRELNDAKPLEFCPDSKTFFLLQQSPRELHALDCQTGELRGTIRLPMCEKGLTRLHLAADKKSVIIKDGPAKTAKSSMWIWLENWFPVLKDHQGQGTYTVVILDPETCRERIRLTIARSDGVYGDLSEDGRTLLTIHPNFDSGDRRELRCWDVNAWKPLHWPIGIPAALAGVLVLFAWWRGRRRKPPVAPSESQ
jgi:hypothetical protein